MKTAQAEGGSPRQLDLTTTRPPCRWRSRRQPSVSGIGRVLGILIWAAGMTAAARHPPKPVAAIHGVVFLPDGFLAANARVRIQTLPHGRHWTDYSDGAGDFLQQVSRRPAQYRLRAQLRGFAPAVAVVQVPGPQVVTIFLHLHRLVRKPQRKP